jgi:hypothetical protein
MLKRFSLFCAFLLTFPAGTSLAERHFTFIYEAPESEPGSFEFEHWVTWKRTTDPARADRVEFRHEIEYGVTNRLQASLYVADWFYQSSPARSGWTYSDAAIELIYNLTNPVKDPVGISIYQEYKAGYQLFEWESKLIAQKNIGRWILVYNATVEAAWEGNDLAEREGELSQALGASYEFSPPISIGLELLHEMVFPDWHDRETIRNLFIGPNVSYRRGHWSVTASALALATDTAGEPDLQIRTIFGLEF